MCNEMREKLVECYGRKQMLGRNYAGRDNRLRWYCVCCGVRGGRRWDRAWGRHGWRGVAPRHWGRGARNAPPGRSGWAPVAGITHIHGPFCPLSPKMPAHKEVTCQRC